MSTKATDNKSQLREQKKRNQLEYGFQVSADIGRRTLLGCAVRAIGKGWRVGGCLGGDFREVFEGLKKKMIDSEKLVLDDLKQKTEVLVLGGVGDRESNLVRNNRLVLGQKHVMAAGEKIDGSYDLISTFRVRRLGNKGVTAITGTGKGKTTTAIGMAVEAVVRGEKAAVIQWFKERKKGRLTWSINEHFFPEMLKDPSLLRFEPMGVGFFGSPNMDRVGEYRKHRECAYKGLELAGEIIKSGRYKVVVLDEFVDTVPEISRNIEAALIELEDVQRLLGECGEQQKTWVVVTGRRVTSDWREFVSRSIEIEEVKHPWSSRGRGAVSGLDY